MKYIATLLFFILLLGHIQLLHGEDKHILKGSGATFPYLLYKKWIEEYQKANSIRVSYQAVGSGKGITSLIEKEVCFGGTDAFISDEKLKKLPEKILHIPTCLGAVVIFYNLPYSPKLNFTPDVIADIFMGRIKNWSDPRIRKINPKAKLPDLKISVIHRSDGSGTTFIFTSYLSAISADWKKKIGEGKKVRWPVGMGIDKNEGVANFVKKISGSIGYTQLAYAKERGMPVASIKNSSGVYIQPTLKSVSAAAKCKLPDDTRTLIIDIPAKDGYPISAFTWLIFYKEQNYCKQHTPASARLLVDFLWWTIHDGQRYAESLLYSPLPQSAVKKAEKIIQSVTFDGKPVMQR